VVAELIILAERALKGAAGKEYSAGTLFTGNGRLFAEVQSGPGNTQVSTLPAKTAGAAAAVHPAFPGTEGTVIVIIHAFRKIRVR
jgi:hypothetical protein